jgi:hypothetical protein
MNHPLPLLLTAVLLLGSAGLAAPLTLSLPAISARPEAIPLGTARRPDGATLTVDSRSLRLNGQPWTPVMGEFHYSRYPAGEWRGELLKMKAGGIDIVATYVFWIHHEELEGQWNWAGDHNLRQFVDTAREVGLKVIVRCGPWCHGEVRNGGLPDWIVARGHTRTEDPAFMTSTTMLYGQIAAQLKGLLWKDGGPVIGIQLDNEYGGPAEYLLRLKKIAIAAGLDVPLYTRTGWPALKTPMPFGEIVPLYGVYAEGFWDRELTSMPGQYWAGFHFSKLRVDANIANEALGRHEAQDAPDVARYPYLTCEIGGGMMSSYHRRILVDPRDIESTTLVKLGSGSVSPGYYMYHGGVNPAGRTTLMEEQATAITNWNDMPVKNYDFQTALGQYGQVRPQYHLLRRLHLFLHSFGAQLTTMDTALPDRRPAGKDDVTTLRWAVRSDGRSGFVFVNNYERGRTLPAKEGVQFAITLADGKSLAFQTGPFTVPVDACFIWPFNLDLGQGVTLAWATAQPLTIVDEGKVRTVYFAETPGIAPRFCFGPEVDPLDNAKRVASGSMGQVYELTPGQAVNVSLAKRDSTQTLRVVVLGTQESLAFGIKPQPAPRPAITVRTELVRAAGPLRTIAPGQCQQPVAAAPLDADFASAAVWRIKLPAGTDLNSDVLLRLHYTGDVARVYIGDKFITDDYYNGLPLEIGLRRHAADLKDGELTIAILPLQKNAPIYFSSAAAKPNFGTADSVVELKGVELVQNQTVESIARP